MRWEDRFHAIVCIAMVAILIWVVALLFRGEKEQQYLTTYGRASWYSTASCQREGTSGIWTASGEKFKENEYTCAIRSREFGKIYIITNLDNGKQCVCWGNDYGPGKRATKRGVIVDLSKGAFRKISNLKEGVINVRVEVFE